MTACFRTLEGTVFNVSNSDIPCSSTNPTGCCAYGDVCMSNGICHYTKPTAVESGFYLQSCTDSTFQSAIGQETLHCTTLDFPDITYNAATGLWACCSSDVTTGVHCSIATNETWAAPAPDALATILSLPPAPPSGTSAPSIETTVPSPTPPPASLSPSATATTSSITSQPSPAAPVPAAISSSSPIPLPRSSPSSSSSNITPTAASATTTTTSSSSSSLSPTISNTVVAGAATTPSTSPATPSASTHKTSLTASAEAGIGVAVAVGLAALLSLVLFALKSLRKHRRRQSSAVLFGGPDPPNEHDVSGATPELGPVAPSGYPYRPPQPQRFTGEPQFLQEMVGGQPRYEARGRQR